MLALVGLSAAISLHAADVFVGAETCRVCHPAQYAAWKEGPHSKSAATLGKRHNDPKCMGCHSTKPQDGLSDVQCESCHGGGAHYSRAYIMKDRKLAEAVGLVVKDLGQCLKCHQGDLPILETFEPGVFWQRLPHSKTRESVPAKP
jgi:hypothetical protein